MTTCARFAGVSVACADPERPSVAAPIMAVAATSLVIRKMVLLLEGSAQRVGFLFALG